MAFLITLIFRKSHAEDEVNTGIGSDEEPVPVYQKQRVANYIWQYPGEKYIVVYSAAFEQFCTTEELRLIFHQVRIIGKPLIRNSQTIYFSLNY